MEFYYEPHNGELIPTFHGTIEVEVYNTRDI